MQPRILLVEDEPGLVLTVTDLLSENGYEVDSAIDGVDGVAKADTRKHDLIILDVMLPKKSGMEVCAELRSRGVDTPIMMLTARTQVNDRVSGLGAGADDYLCKPFDPLELVARIQALLRRAARKPFADALPRIHIGNTVVVDVARCELTRDGQVIPIGGKELELLRYLAENPNRVISREELLTEVWQYGAGLSSRTVDVHIAWLRQKLEIDPQRPRYLHTARGSGYRFTP
jgi:two-component system alkaline phosphatase synthesis response regulator PhoP